MALRPPWGAERSLSAKWLRGALLALTSKRNSLYYFVPHIPEVDGPVFVKRAVRITATEDLNPRWFTHLSSIVIYC